MDLIIACLGEVIVKVFVYLIERIASIAIDTKLYTLLDIQRSFFAYGMPQDYRATIAETKSYTLLIHD